MPVHTLTTTVKSDKKVLDGPLSLCDERNRSCRERTEVQEVDNGVDNGRAVQTHLTPSGRRCGVLWNLEASVFTRAKNRRTGTGDQKSCAHRMRTGNLFSDSSFTLPVLCCLI